MEIYFREDQGKFRVWDISWEEDFFKIFTAEEFETFRRLGKRLGLQFFEAED